MTYDPTIFGALMASVAARLNESEWFRTAGITVLTADAGNLREKIDEDLQEGLSLVLDIGEIAPMDSDPAVTVELRLEGAEDPEINRADPDAGPTLETVLVAAWGVLVNPDWAPDGNWDHCEFRGLSAPEFAAETGHVMRVLTVRTANTIGVR